MKYKAIIIDDEYKLRELLAMKLRELFPEIEIIAMINNIQDAYQQCIELKPDIVFLDVEMPQGTGFDFIKKFSAIDFEIIFATAHQEYALEAFKVSATGFILKPYSNEDIETAVNTAIELLDIKHVSKKYDILIENLKPQNSQNQQLVIPCKDRYEFVQIDDITYCEGDDKYTFLHVKDGRKILSSKYIGKFKVMLANHQFFVSHKSYIVNMKMVKALTNEDQIVLTNNEVIPLARRRKVEFMHALLGK